MNEGPLRSPIHRSEKRRRIAQSNLKRCPLCNALNARANDDCFVCGWAGRFDHDPFRIEESLIRLIYQCPELEQEIPSLQKKPTLVQRALARLRRHIDLSA